MSYLLHVRFNFDGKTGNKDEDIAIAFPFKQSTTKMNNLENLKWKIWGHDDNVTECAGFYLYPTKESAEARAEECKVTLPYLDEISNVRTEVWEVLDDYSLETHAPIDVPLIAEL